MKSVSKTVVEFVGLGAAALIVAFAVNATRVKGAIKIGKNYFEVGAAKDTSAAPMDHVATPEVVAKPVPHPAAANPDHASNPLPTKGGEEHLEHPYQQISFDEALALHNDPLTESGLNVFIDARNEERFAEGHIPGALRCNPYQVERDIDPIIERVKAAEKIVVYCGGGKCEDSIFMCRELAELDIPYDSIFLYEGGWKEWSAKGGPTATGDQ